MMTDELSRRTPGRPRRREIDERILEAARSLLAGGGYEAMTFDAISTMTGLGRPTIYRRWRTKAHLAAEVAYGNDEKLPETGGDLRTQIHALVRQIAEGYQRPEVGAAAVALISIYQNDAELRDELHTPAEEAARRQLHSIVARAIGRGEIRPDVDADMLFDIMVGTLVFRLIFSSTKRPPDLVQMLTDHLCNALAPCRATGEP